MHAMIILVVVGAWLAWTVTQEPSVPSGGRGRDDAAPSAALKSKEPQKRTVAPMPPLPRMAEAVTAGTGSTAPTRELTSELGSGLGGGLGCYTGFSPYEGNGSSALFAHAQPLV